MRKNAPAFGVYIPTDLWQELAELGTPVTPNGQAIVGTVEDLEAQMRIKAQEARKAVDTLSHLVAQDLLAASYWMDVRRTQNPAR